MSAINNLQRYLQSGRRATAAQIRAMFKVENPHDLVYRLRNQGHAVYTNRATLKDGTKTFAYRLGMPSDHFVKNFKKNRTEQARFSLYHRALRTG